MIWLRAQFVNLIVIAVMIFVALAGARVVSSQSADIERLGAESHAALCALRDDIERRHDASARYLAEHPRGLVSATTGEVIISAAQIRDGMKDQQDTLDALDGAGLNCN